MSRLQEVDIGVKPIDRLLPLVGQERMDRAYEVAGRLRTRMEGRVLWNVNSTASGGGVAELLRSLIAYLRSLDVDARWLTLEGTSEFFRITKRLHHALHGFDGDGARLDDGARATYEQVLQANAEELLKLVRPRDIVFLHDPQTAGLVPSLARAGATVIWRCHVGADQNGEQVELGWDFLERYLEDAAAIVFSRNQYIPECCDHGRSIVVPPSIDPLSVKNQELDDDTVRAILVQAGLIEGPQGSGSPTFLREDGSPGCVVSRADVIRQGGPPTWETPLVVQVSRWDPLKDPIGVMKGFVENKGAATSDAALVLAGPDQKAIADDPEQAAVHDEVAAAWRRLAPSDQSRVHLASLPMQDIEENAAIVNALQRHASVVVQKSLQEGFGLTVTEAMWKACAIVASAVGGIQDQIAHGVHGLLLRDPTDTIAFGSALCRILEDDRFASHLGKNAHQRVHNEYLSIRHLIQYADLIERIDK